MERAPGAGNNDMAPWLVRLRDAWTRAEAAQLLTEVRLTSAAYTIETYADQELSPDGFVTGHAG